MMKFRVPPIQILVFIGMFFGLNFDETINVELADKRRIVAMLEHYWQEGTTKFRNIVNYKLVWQVTPFDDKIIALILN